MLGETGRPTGMVPGSHLHMRHGMMTRCTRSDCWLGAPCTALLGLSCRVRKAPPNP